MSNRPRMSAPLSLAVAVLTNVTAFAEPNPLDPNADHLYYADLLSATAKFDDITILEGLSRDYENASPAQVAAAHGFKIDRQSLSIEPLPMKDEEKIAVSDAILKHIENFKVWSGTKFCGGFHADFAVEWRLKGTVVAQALLCFSCHEARFYVGNRVELVDQSDAGFQTFKTLLFPHRRPQASTPSGSAPPLPLQPAEKEPVPKVEIIAPPPVPVGPPPEIEISPTPPADSKKKPR